MHLALVYENMVAIFFPHCYLFADEKKYPRGMVFVADRVYDLRLLKGRILVLAK